MKVYNGSSWQVVAPTVTTVDNSTWSGTDLAVVHGGTGASSAGAARTALGVAIGTDVLAPDGDGSSLTGIDALPSQSGNAGKYLSTNGSAASWAAVSGVTQAKLIMAGAI